MSFNRINRFKVLEFPQDPTDYEDFENIAPYNKLKDGKWTSLWLNKHPLAYKISHRFGGNYDGKLFWKELNELKEEIEKLQEYQDKCDKETLSRKIEIRTLIREQEKLCKEDNRLDTILLSAISAYNSDNPIEAPLGAFVQQVDDAMNMMRNIISFIPLETCEEKLQKHLEQCNRLSGKYKCTKDHDTYMCQFMDIGRCEHFYEIQKYLTELEGYECYDDEEQDKINELEYQYERALAVKEDRLREYLDNLYADDY